MSRLKHLKSKIAIDRQQEEMRKISQQLALDVAGALAEAQEERARCEAFIAAIGDSISVQDTEFRIVYQNPLMQKNMGDHVGEHCFRAYAGKEAICADCLMAAAFSDGKLHRGEREFIHPNGKRVQLEFTVSPVRDATGKVVASIELVRDISERKMSEWRLVTQHAVSCILAETPTVDEAIPRVLKAICEAIGWDVGGVWWVDSDKERLMLYDTWHKPDLDVSMFEKLNRTVTFAPGIGLPGRVWATGEAAWIPDVPKDGNFPRGAAAEKSGLHGGFAFPIILGGATVGVMEFFSHDVREPEPVLLSAMVPLGIQLGQLIERKRSEEQLRHMSTHDTLTGLYNRAFFEEEMKRLARGRQFPVSVIMADLDGLKVVNDKLGHDAGNRLLQKAARILLAAFRAEDVVARIGGDEFAMLMPETDGRAAEDAMARIRKYQGEANLSAGDFRVSISLGAATADSGEDVTNALKLSDEMMYRDKLARKKSAVQPSLRLP